MATSTKHLSVTISAEMLSYLPHTVSSIFLNDARFASDRIAMLLSLLAHLNLSSRKNILLAISYLTRLEMGAGESSIYFISRIRVVSQCLKGVPTEQIITLFSNRKPGT